MNRHLNTFMAGTLVLGIVLPAMAQQQNSRHPNRNGRGVNPPLATTTLTTRTTSTTLGVQTQVCTDCSEGATPRQARNPDIIKQIKELQDEVNRLKAAASTTTTTLTPVATATAAKQDAEYDRLSCATETVKYDQAICLAGNLDDIQEATKEAPRGRERTRLTTLYSKAQRIIKNQLVSVYDVSDTQDLPEARDRFSELESAVAKHDNDRLNRDIRELKKGLERQTQRRFTTEQLTDIYDDHYAPELNRYRDELDLAAQSGNLEWKFRAQSQYDVATLQTKQLLQQMKLYDPSNENTRLSRIADPASFDYFDRYYNDSYESILSNLRDLGLNNLDRGLNDYSRIGGVRQSRGGSSSSIMSMPAFGSDYNNRLISPSNPMDSFYNTNSLTNGSTSDYLSRNPGLLSRPRGRS